MPILYRGLQKPIKNGTYKNKFLNKPRQPLNTPIVIHKAVDEWFNTAFGIQARSRCIFCTPSLEAAKKYRGSDGSLIEITPTITDELAFIFSESVIDFTDLISFDTYKDPESYVDKLLSRLDGMNYKKVSRQDKIPINFSGEVMLYCREYNVENYD